MTQTLTSNGGPHPPSSWANIIADRLVDDSALYGGRQMQAQQVKAQIAEALLPLMSEIQGEERVRLYTDGATLLSAIDATPYLNELVLAVQAVTRDSAWVEHFLRDAVVQAVRDSATPMINTMIHIERLWWMDANPQSPHVAAFNTRFSQGN